MRLYKLLKDTPTIKAGTMFREVVSDFDRARELVRVTPISAKTNPQWTIQDVDNFDGWPEPVVKLLNQVQIVPSRTLNSTVELAA